MRPAHAAFDEGSWLRPASLRRRRARRIGTRDGVDAQLAKLLIEKTVVRPAAEFAVGRKTQADALLQANRV